MPTAASKEAFVYVDIDTDRAVVSDDIQTLQVCAFSGDVFLYAKQAHPGGVFSRSGHRNLPWRILV